MLDLISVWDKLVLISKAQNRHVLRVVYTALREYAATANTPTDADIQEAVIAKQLADKSKVFKKAAAQLLETKNINSNAPDYVYVLKLIEGKYYVGTTNDLASRLTQHYTGKGATVTKRYVPVELLAVFLGGTEMESEVTLRVMKTRGINSTYGAGWASLTALRDTTKLHIWMEAIGTTPPPKNLLDTPVLFENLEGEAK